MQVIPQESREKKRMEVHPSNDLPAIAARNVIVVRSGTQMVLFGKSRASPYHHERLAYFVIKKEANCFAAGSVWFFDLLYIYLCWDYRYKPTDSAHEPCRWSQDRQFFPI